METLLHDLKYSLRVLRKSPGVTLAAVLCIGLGIGANAAIFGILDSVVLRPLPFADPDRLVVIGDTYEADGERQTTQVSRANYLAWQGQTPAFQAMAAAEIGYLNLTGGGEPIRVRNAFATASLFPLLGVEPVLGRTFLPEEDRPGGAPVAVLSHSFWRSRFGGDRGVLGRTVMLDGRGHTIVGVMPEGFRYPEGESNPGGPALWLPLGIDSADPSPAFQWHTLIVPARLAPGVTIEQAQAAMDGVARRLAGTHPQTNDGWGVELTSLHRELVGDVRPVLTVLMAVVGFVLLIACVNVANLQIARGLTRRAELSVRMALGCGRRRLFRQIVTESVVLALLGGLAGLALAYLAIPLLLPLNPAQLSMFESVRIDARVMAFTLLVSLAAGALFGLVPAARATRLELGGSLKEGNGRVVGRGPGRALQSALVVAQVALALVLLVSAGLLTKTLLRLQRVDPGFETRNLLTMGMILPAAKYPEKLERNAFVDRLLERVRALPGVETAGTSLVLPAVGDPLKSRVVVEGRAADDAEVLVANLRLVSPGFLETMGIDLVRGRRVTAADDATAAPVAVISEEMARRYWPGKDPLGRRVRRFSPTLERPWMTIVGIVRDVKDGGLDAAPEPTWYLPFTQHDDSPALRLVVKTAAEPLAMTDAVRGAVHALDPDQAVYDVASIEGLLAKSLVQRRFSAFLVGLFAVLGLVMMVIGLYGVISHVVHQRAREIGIRIALGARPGSVLAMTLREGMMLTLWGLTLGLLGTFFLTRVLSTLVFGVRPTDLPTLVQTSLALGAAALAATLLPARRATQVDPLIVLKE